jgi:hypothetical protein
MIQDSRSDAGSPVARHSSRGVPIGPVKKAVFYAILILLVLGTFEMMARTYFAVLMGPRSLRGRKEFPASKSEARIRKRNVVLNVR